MNRLAEEGAVGLTALTFFTRVPGPPRFAPTSRHLARSITWFPLVGWFVGAVSALAWWAAGLLWPATVAAGVAVAAAILLTGALHEDGWADACDGFGGGSSRSRTLEIMKDPHIGAFGVLGLVLVIGMHWTALASLPASAVPASLVCVHALSRGAAAVQMAVLDYARPGSQASKSRALATRLRGTRLAVVLVTAVVPLALLPWPAALALVGATIGLAFASALFLWRRLGGYTGDCLGAVQQLTLVGGLLALLAVS